MKILDFAQIWHTSALGGPKYTTQILGSSSNRKLLKIAFQFFGPKMANFRPFFRGDGTTTQWSDPEKRLLQQVHLRSGSVASNFIWQRRQGRSSTKGELLGHFSPP